MEGMGIYIQFAGAEIDDFVSILGDLWTSLTRGDQASILPESF